MSKGLIESMPVRPANDPTKPTMKRVPGGLLLLVVAGVLSSCGSIGGNGISANSDSSGAAGVFGATPIAGPALNNAVESAAALAAEVLTAVETDASLATHSVVNLPDHGPISPADRRVLMRSQLGLPEPPDMRLARRRHEHRLAMQQFTPSR